MDLAEQVRELTEMTARIRREFIWAELNTCFASMEMAKFEVSIGNLAVASREISATEKGIQVVERFLEDLTDEDRVPVTGKLNELKSGLESVKREFEQLNSLSAP